ncbi:MAG: ATP-binding protein [Nitriliruptoraceae bacterium]|nr:ATP-binding protein [Nitriliruptoraceae bacterium]
MDQAPPIEPSLRYLLGRLGMVEWRIALAIDQQRELEGGAVDGRFRGLVVSPEQVERLLTHGPIPPPDPPEQLLERSAALEATADEWEDAGHDLRLRTLATRFSLNTLEVDLLLIALAPELDRRFEHFYGALNDDVARRHATVGLALQLTGRMGTDTTARAAFGADAPLRRGGLLELDDASQPALGQPVTVPRRVVDHLLGDDTPDDVLTDLLHAPLPVVHDATDGLIRALQAGARSGYVRSRLGSGPGVAMATLERIGLPEIAIDLERAGPDLERIGRAAGREALLQGGVLIVGPVDAVIDDRGHAALQPFRAAGATVLFHGQARWDPHWTDDVPAVVETGRIPAPAQAEVWALALADAPLTDGVDPVEATALFRLSPEQIERAARTAHHHAAVEDRAITIDDLHHGARAQNAAGLQRLARRISPQAGWQDLILPDDITAQLRELASRWRLRDVVLEDWGLGAGTARGRGVSALFAGASGTGKTLASEVIAAELGLDLYVVELSTVVDKYIGETSKNLERIFDEADRVNGVLLFDEADALFGKRSAVSDAKDRHANVEVAYLLQRMEDFDGVAILTTNLAANLDEAFMRRLDAVVDFPSPDLDQRRALWRAKLPTSLPQSDDVDIDLLADRFKVSGSEIRNITLSAAYRAAAADRAVTMDDLLRATIREHRKIGRHLAPSDLAGFPHLQEPTS